LLSDQAKDWWIFLNNKFWIEKYFDQSILSFEVWTKKPELDIYKITLQKVWSKAQNSIFIDDLESNLIPAKKLWIKTILFEDCEKLKNDLYLNKINL
jgi:HAD superfamily hydrolase (TIGR01509 family)